MECFIVPGAEGYGFWYNRVFKKFPPHPHGDSIAYQLVPSVDRFDHAKLIRLLQQAKRPDRALARLRRFHVKNRGGALPTEARRALGKCWAPPFPVTNHYWLLASCCVRLGKLGQIVIENNPVTSFPGFQVLQGFIGLRHLESFDYRRNLVPCAKSIRDYPMGLSRGRSRLPSH